MHKCIETRFQPFLKWKNLIFKAMFQVIWKYAKMPQKYLVSGGFEKRANASKHVFNHFMFLVVWKYAQMHQNTFLALHTLKNIFLKNFILVVWKYAQMRKNTFLATPDVNKFLF